MTQAFLLDIRNTQVVLHYGTILTDAILTDNSDDHLLAKVNHNPEDPSILGLKNLSQQEWTVTFDDGETRLTPPGRTIKLEENLSIDFGNLAGTIRKINTEQIDTILFEASPPAPTAPIQEKFPPSENVTPPTSNQNFSSNTTFDSESRAVKVEQIKQQIDAIKSKEPDYQSTRLQGKSSFSWAPLWWILAIIAGGFAIHQFNQATHSPPTTFEQEEIDNCAEVERKKQEYRGKINWAAVDEAFWQQTDYPYGQPLDSSSPDYQYYRQQWCAIANQYLN